MILFLSVCITSLVLKPCQQKLLLCCCSSLTVLGHLLKVLNQFPCTVWNIQLQIYQARKQISPLFLASCGAVHSSSKWPEGRRNKSDHQWQQAGCWLRAPCPHQLLQAVHGPQVGAGLGAGTGVVTRAKALGRLVLSPKKSGRARVLMGGTTACWHGIPSVCTGNQPGSWDGVSWELPVSRPGGTGPWHVTGSSLSSVRGCSGQAPAAGCLQLTPGVLTQPH